MSKKDIKAWFVYMVLCNDGTLYTGVTTDISRRVEEHNTGKGAKYTRSRRPVRLQDAWSFPNKSSALREEHRIKKMSRKEKEQLLITLV